MKVPRERWFDEICPAKRLRERPRIFSRSFPTLVVKLGLRDIFIEVIFLFLPGGTMSQISEIKQIFKEQLEDFQDFENPGKEYLEHEYNYKKALSEMAHEMLDEWLDHGPDSMKVDDFRELLERLLRRKIPNADMIQNLAGWRDNSIFFDEILSGDVQTQQFMGLLHGLLREGAKGPDVSTSLGSLLNWLNSQECPPASPRFFPPSSSLSGILMPIFS
jgi:hypothetical protein